MTLPFPPEFKTSNTGGAMALADFVGREELGGVSERIADRRPKDSTENS